jgi:hypothetical protein
MPLKKRHWTCLPANHRGQERIEDARVVALIAFAAGCRHDWRPANINTAFANTGIRIEASTS